MQSEPQTSAALIGSSDCASGGSGNDIGEADGQMGQQGRGADSSQFGSAGAAGN